MSCILGVPGLARDSHVELGPLQKANCLPNEDVSQALALHRELRINADRRKEKNGQTSCWFRILVERSAGLAVGGSTGEGPIRTRICFYGKMRQAFALVLDHGDNDSLMNVSWVKL